MKLPNRRRAEWEESSGLLHLDKAMLHKKICEAAAVKLFDEGHGSFTAYASTWGNLDRAGEKFVRGAFKNLDAFLANGFVPVGHDWSALPVATISDVKEDDLGLVIRADFHSTAAAQDARTVVRERLERGKFVGTSVGFKLHADGFEDTDDGRILKAADLFEVSIVTVPCNPLAAVVGAKDSPADSITDERMRLVDQAKAVRAAVDALAIRTEEVIDLRAKEGRTISAATDAELEAIEMAVEDCAGRVKRLRAMRSRAPEKSAGDLFAEYQQTLARLSGVRA